VTETFGFTFERISGSHHIYSHPAISQPISVQPDHNGQAKSYQMKQFTKLIEKYDLRLQDDLDE
jgi:predicted RNA binding protein YcfA (HicA-like mRNA interferase family)